jgi:antitoxin HigA-1
MRRLPKNRRPTLPGEVFLEDFLLPLGITQREAAARLRISYPRMNEIVNGRRAVTPDTALRLAKFTSTEPEFWLNLQQAIDLWDALHSDQAAELEEIQPAHAQPGGKVNYARQFGANGASAVPE